MASNLTQTQVDGFNHLIKEGFQRKCSLPEIAYILATAWHETNKTLRPIAEYGRGRGKKYGVRHPKTGHVYYGRGYPQLTWDYNYEKMGKYLGIDLLNNPDEALKVDVSTKILYEGCLRGMFTGKALRDYIGPGRLDFVNARRVVNGIDRAELIASYAEHFHKALLLAS